MDEIKRLVETDQLKTNYIKAQAQKKPSFEINYDKLSDALIVKLNTPTDQEVVTHYLDDHFALLYLAESLEVVGFKVEDFEYSFLPNHVNVARIWRLSEANTDIKNMGDLIFVIQTMKPKVAREVVKAAEDILGEPGAELAAVFA